MTQQNEIQIEYNIFPAHPDTVRVTGDFGDGEQRTKIVGYTTMAIAEGDPVALQNYMQHEAEWERAVLAWAESE